MSTTTTFPFTTAGNYTYDADKIEVTGGVAQLKLEPEADSYTEAFTADTGHTYDNTKVTFAAGKASQVDQAPTNLIAGNNFNVGKDLAFGVGTLTGTLNGGATVSGGRADITGYSAGKNITYNGDNFTATDVFTINLIVTPNYTGSPSSEVTYIDIYEGSSSLNNRIAIYHATNGNLTVRAYDTAGSIIFNKVSAWSPSSGTTYEIELNANVTTGVMNVFLNGVSIASGTHTGTRSSAGLTVISSGLNYLSSGVGNHYLNQLAIYNVVKHTSGYTPPTVTLEDYKYLESTVQIPARSYSGIGSFVAFTNLTPTVTASPQYSFAVDGGSFYYWNGSAWAVSDGTFSQSATSANSVSNFATFPGMNGATSFIVKVHFANGTTLYEIDNLVVDFTETNTYYTDNPTILTNTSVTVDVIESLTETVTTAASDTIKYVINVDGTDKYWNGSAWATSSSYSQSNTIADINTNIASLDLNRSVVKLKAYLNSDGTTTPLLDELSMLSITSLASATAPNLCHVQGYLYGASGPRASKVVKVRPLTGFQNGDAFHDVGSYETLSTTDENGYFEGSVYSSIDSNGNTLGYWEFKIGNEETYKIAIPNQQSVDWEDLTKVVV